MKGNREREQSKRERGCCENEQKIKLPFGHKRKKNYVGAV